MIEKLKKISLIKVSLSSNLYKKDNKIITTGECLSFNSSNDNKVPEKSLINNVIIPL